MPLNIDINTEKQLAVAPLVIKPAEVPKDAFSVALSLTLPSPDWYEFSKFAASAALCYGLGIFTVHFLRSANKRFWRSFDHGFCPWNGQKPPRRLDKKEAKI